METPRKPLRNISLEANTPFKVPASPMMKALGYGTGVNVYCMERSPKASGPRSPWAIKRVSQRIRATNQENSKIFNERIVKEATILRQLKHPNIVGFRALSKQQGDLDSLALECCETSLGSILEQRLDNGGSALPAKHIKKMLLDISNALHYLHTEAKLLHGDMKSHNVLVKGSDFEVCKLCDFGVSLPLDVEGKVDFRKNPELRYVGTTLWCAPEVIAEEDVIDSKADIFSLGLIIYETIALTPPHMLARDDSESYLETSTEEDMLNEADTEGNETTEMSLSDLAYGTRPQIPQALELSDDYNIVMELFYLCTNNLPIDRPTAKIIFSSLNQHNTKN
ncbi:lymphokine-activated killer T-cell-originated protein kinase [Stomoxys calcitrans]|uniref:lymphokine-activated killer T-cell-originated protein kinase n=1 Tax=Stomoxys calcitrans TaxID=35570 RepID=UPI0027E39C21|nr:lymphokine-activated killer T-cell-originated protein kinase [Stomoxys calcitrans]